MFIKFLNHYSCMVESLNFKFLIDRSVRLPGQDHNFEHFYGYREHLQKVVNELDWKIVSRTLGGPIIGGYYSFNASIVPSSGSLISIVFNRNASGPEGYQEGIIISDEESIAMGDLNTLEGKMREIHPAYYVEIGDSLIFDGQKISSKSTRRAVDVIY